MAWSQTDKDNWFAQQKIQRSYKNEVVSKILALKKTFDVDKYGALSINPELYPVYLIKSRNFDTKKEPYSLLVVSTGMRPVVFMVPLLFLKNPFFNT